MKIRFRTGLLLAGSTALALVAVNATNVSGILRLAMDATRPGQSAETVSPAAVPPPVIITKQNPDGFTLKINTGNNPFGTEYAVWEASTDRWVNPLAKSISSSLPVWVADLGAWDTPRGGVALTGLTPNKAYTFFAKARNSAKAETALGPAAIGFTIYSPDAPVRSAIARIATDDEAAASAPAAEAGSVAQAEAEAVPGLLPPGRPAVVSISPQALRLIIDPGGNTSSTAFAIKDALSGRFVQADGTFGTKAVYRIFLDWGGDSGFVVKTEPNHAYRFQTLAKPRGE